MITHVRQTDAYGCGVAALAMVTGRTYDEVKAYLVGVGKVFDGERGGIHELDVENYLDECGYAIRKRYRWYGANIERETWPVPPFAPVHICSVRNPGGWHFVVLLADGRVLDPVDEQPKTLAAWPEIGYVMGIWKV